MNLTGLIESAERQFRQVLEDFFISVYDEKSLISHGLEHHRRVWNNAKELLFIHSLHEKIFSSQFISKLIIACYLHDIGMVIDSGERHGLHSKNLCIDFLTRYGFNIQDYEDLLLTIEHHDRKDYGDRAEENKLLTILSVADDLDAFGFSGIYRYSEIYITRGIDPLIIGNLIIENASKRFIHFKKNFAFDNSLIHKHSERYSILTGFFTEYNNQIHSVNAGAEDFNENGYNRIIQFFIKLIKENLDIREIYREQEKYPDDGILKWYIDGLKSEMG